MHDYKEQVELKIRLLLVELGLNVKDIKESLITGMVQTLSEKSLRAPGITN